MKLPIPFQLAPQQVYVVQFDIDDRGCYGNFCLKQEDAGPPYLLDESPAVTIFVSRCRFKVNFYLPRKSTRHDFCAVITQAASFTINKCLAWQKHEPISMQRNHRYQFKVATDSLGFVDLASLHFMPRIVREKRFKPYKHYYNKRLYVTDKTMKVSFLMPLNASGDEIADAVCSAVDFAIEQHVLLNFNYLTWKK